VTRPPRRVAGCALVASAALAAGCGGGGSHIHLPVQKVASRLPTIRGLRFKRVPAVSVVSKSELDKLSADQLLARLRRLPAAQRARVRGLLHQAQAAAEVPVLLGLVPPHPTRSAVEKAAQLEGVYEPTTNHIYLIREQLGNDPRVIETILAHELTHALDVQNLGPDRFDFHRPLMEAADADRSVREGSAVLSQARYAIRYLSAIGPVSFYLDHWFSVPGGSRLARVVGKELTFVYVAGPRFVYALYRRGGWPLVNRALRNPPKTTASILFPQRWPAHDVSRPPVGDPSPAFGGGWTRVLAGDMDDFSTDELFSQTGPGSAVKAILRDWMGGRLSLWHRRGVSVAAGAPDRRNAAAVLQWRWRAPSDSGAATAAIATYLMRTFSARPAGRGAWQWPGGAAASLSAGDTTALVLAPNAALAHAAAAAAVRARSPLSASGSPSR